MLGSVAGAVAATAAAGLLLSGLRERSGSLAAPVLLHLTANSGAVVAAWAARPRQQASRRPDGPGWRAGRTRRPEYPPR
jgi:hypothetical protein